MSAGRERSFGNLQAAPGASRYSVQKRLARGGAAELLLAERVGSLGFRKKVVIKRILKGVQDDDVRLFLAEAHLASHFNHPNLVQVYDLEEVGGRYALVMEYLEGVDLRGVLDRTTERGSEIPTHIAAQIVAEAAAGLHYAHTLVDENGEPLRIVHRDIAPANIFLTWFGGVKVVDFGIAKYAGSEVNTQDGFRRGRLAYMSPEHLEGVPLDARSDVFSLGVVLFEMLTVTRWISESDSEPIASKKGDSGIRRLRPDLPEALTVIVERMLHQDIETRYASAEQVADDLRGFLAEDREPGTAGLAGFLRRLYIDDREDTLTNVPVPVSFSDIATLEQTHPGIAAAAIHAVTSKNEVSPSRRFAAEPRSSSSAALVVGLAVFVAVLVASAILIVVTRPSAAPSSPTKLTVAKPLPPAPPVEPLSVADPAPAPEATPKPPEPVAETGSLTLLSEPVVEVFLEDESLGLTPLRGHALPAGTHRVTIRNRDQWLVRTFDVVIREGKVTRRVFEFGKGALEVKAEAGSRIIVDGQRVGEAPHEAISLAEGIHRVVVVNPTAGTRQRKRIEVRPGEISSVDFEGGEP